MTERKLKKHKLREKAKKKYNSILRNNKKHSDVKKKNKLKNFKNKYKGGLGAK